MPGLSVDALGELLVWLAMVEFEMLGPVELSCPVTVAFAGDAAALSTVVLLSGEVALVDIEAFALGLASEVAFALPFTFVKGDGEVVLDSVLFNAEVALPVVLFGVRDEFEVVFESMLEPFACGVVELP